MQSWMSGNGAGPLGRDTTPRGRYTSPSRVPGPEPRSAQPLADPGAGMRPSGPPTGSGGGGYLLPVRGTESPPRPGGRSPARPGAPDAGRQSQNSQASQAQSLQQPSQASRPGRGTPPQATSAQPSPAVTSPRRAVQEQPVAGVSFRGGQFSGQQAQHDEKPLLRANASHTTVAASSSRNSLALPSQLEGNVQRAASSASSGTPAPPGEMAAPSFGGSGSLPQPSRGGELPARGSSLSLAAAVPAVSAVPAPSADTARLEAKMWDLEQANEAFARKNEELETQLDDHGQQFLEALFCNDKEIEDLKRQNQKLKDERAMFEEQLQTQGADSALRSKNQQLEEQCQDAMAELDIFEREKEEELRQAREDTAAIQRRMAQADAEYQRRINEMERDRDNLLEAMTEEGQELQARIKKLNRDKEGLSMDLARALARQDAGNSELSADPSCDRPTSAHNVNEVSSQLKKVTEQREALKDEVTSREGQIVLLRSQLEIALRKLRLADMENQMLKREIADIKMDITEGAAGEKAAAARRGAS